VNGLPLIPWVLLPATFFFVSRRIDFPVRAAAIAALLGPLAIGVPHAFAVHLVLWSFAAAWIAMRHERLWFVPSVLVTLTAVVDPSYGYFAGIGICLIASAQPDRAARIAWIVLASALLSSFIWIPWWIERAGPIPSPAASAHAFEFQLALTWSR
jgi:hypothetical protein